MRILAPAANAAEELATFDQIPDVPNIVAEGGSHSNLIASTVSYIGSIAVPAAGRYRVHGYVTFTNPANSTNTFSSMDYTGTESAVTLQVLKMNLGGSLAGEDLTAMGEIANGSATTSAFYRHDWCGMFTCSNSGTLRIGLRRGSSSVTLAGLWMLEVSEVV